MSFSGVLLRFPSQVSFSDLLYLMVGRADIQASHLPITPNNGVICRFGSTDWLPTPQFESSRFDPSSSGCFVQASSIVRPNPVKVHLMLRMAYLYGELLGNCVIVLSPNLLSLRQRNSGQH